MIVYNCNQICYKYCQCSEVTGVTMAPLKMKAHVNVYQNKCQWIFFYLLKNTTFQKLDLFLSSDEGVEAFTLLGSLERANLNQCWVC
jgi:hypothetical protein